jgi:uncharacterized integral membrane protein (TIGR00698 family)
MSSAAIKDASNKLLFFLGAAVVLTGLASPPVALALGIGFGMFFSHPYGLASGKWAKWLLQFSVVALGFGMNFGDVVRSGRASFLFTAIGISFAMLTGIALGKVFGVRSKAAFLIAAGTAICGGSAIAAIAPVLEPDAEELAMSMGTVFTLNSLALFLFPIIGLALRLTQTQFGLWSALAIHDTSSVVGAAAKFGPQALAIATVVKLTRALWIIPVALLTAWFSKSNSGNSTPGKKKARVKIPWFILLFCVAALARTSFTGLAPVFTAFVHAAHSGLALTLFLIGTGISMNTVRQAGSRVIAQGVLLWIVVASASLFAIHAGWILL